jgi:hypothetical protein
MGALVSLVLSGRDTERERERERERGNRAESQHHAVYLPCLPVELPCIILVLINIGKIHLLVSLNYYLFHRSSNF